MVTIDSKLGLAVYRLDHGYNPGRFMHFVETSIEMLTHEGISRFIIDFTDYQSISTRDLMTLVKLAGSLPGDSIMLSGIPEHITKLLKTTGLFKIFRIFPDAASAIKAVIPIHDRSIVVDKNAADESLATMKPASA